MPRPYSIDLRKRVLEAVDEKTLSIEEISKRFTVNPKTIYLWRKRREETGRIEPITHKTMQDECYNIIFRKKIYNSLEDLQIDIDHWLRSYNESSPHSGKYCYAYSDFS